MSWMRDNCWHFWRKGAWSGDCRCYPCRHLHETGHDESPETGATEEMT